MIPSKLCLFACSTLLKPWTSVPFKLRNCAIAQHHQTIAQSYPILVHFQHYKFNAVCVYRIVHSTLETLHWLRVCMVAQLHALNAQKNKHLLCVQFS